MKILNLIAILVCLQLVACQSPDSNNSKSETTDIPKVSSIYERLEPQEFQTKLSAEKKPQLIDVRTPEEYAQGNIEGSLNLNFYDTDFDKKLAQLDKTKTIFVYCKSGGRSKKTAEKLKQMGFNEIYELKTGYMGWER